MLLSLQYRRIFEKYYTNYLYTIFRVEIILFVIYATIYRMPWVWEKISMCTLVHSALFNFNILFTFNRRKILLKFLTCASKKFYKFFEKTLLAKFEFILPRFPKKFAYMFKNAAHGNATDVFHMLIIIL